MATSDSINGDALALFTDVRNKRIDIKDERPIKLWYIGLSNKEEGDFHKKLDSYTKATETLNEVRKMDKTILRGDDFGDKLDEQIYVYILSK